MIRKLPPDERTADMTDGPPLMTTMEKLANNLITIVIARAAMIVTPMLLGIIWNGMNNRLEKVETVSAVHASQIQDHESRLVNGKLAREDFQTQAQENFTAIENSFRELNVQIVSLSGSIIRLQTTIENRLPARNSSVMEDAQ